MSRSERVGSPPAEGKRYYRIGEVAKLTGVKPHVLRYWETEFRWMAPPKSRSRQRLYRPRDIEMVKAIKKLLYEERYTIAGARIRLRELGLANARAAVAEPKSPPAPTGQDAERLRTGYQRIRSELQRIRSML